MDDLSTEELAFFTRLVEHKDFHDMVASVFESAEDVCVGMLFPDEDMQAMDIEIAPHHCYDIKEPPSKNYYELYLQFVSGAIVHIMVPRERKSIVTFLSKGGSA